MALRETCSVAADEDIETTFLIDNSACSSKGRNQSPRANATTNPIATMALDHLEGHLLPAGLNLSALQQLLDSTTASAPPHDGASHNSGLGTVSSLGPRSATAAAGGDCTDEGVPDLRSGTRENLVRLCPPQELISDLAGLTVIGHGSRSVVCQALWRGARVVTKFSACPSLSPNTSAVIRQALVSKALAHPNVLQHFSVRCCRLTGSTGALSESAAVAATAAGQGCPTRQPSMVVAASASAACATGAANATSLSAAAGINTCSRASATCPASSLPAFRAMPVPAPSTSVTDCGSATAAAATVTAALPGTHGAGSEGPEVKDTAVSAPSFTAGPPGLTLGSASMPDPNLACLPPTLTHLSGPSGISTPTTCSVTATTLAQSLGGALPSRTGGHGGPGGEVAARGLSGSAAGGAATLDLALGVGIGAAHGSSGPAGEQQSAAADGPQHQRQQQGSRPGGRRIKRPPETSPGLRCAAAAGSRALWEGFHGAGDGGLGGRGGTASLWEEAKGGDTAARSARAEAEAEASVQGRAAVESAPKALAPAAADLELGAGPAPTPDPAQAVPGVSSSTAADPRSATPAAAADAAPGAPAPAAPVPAGTAPGAATPGSLSFNSYEGFGNPFGSSKHSLNLQHVATLVAAREGEYLTAIIMEHADKATLLHAVKRGLFVPNRVWTARVALRALLRTALEIAFALQHLHSRSVVHGSLRPANVLLKSANLDRRGFTVKVTNFSLARVCCGAEDMSFILAPAQGKSKGQGQGAATVAATTSAGAPGASCVVAPGLSAPSASASACVSSRGGSGLSGGGCDGGLDVFTSANAAALPFWSPEQLSGIVCKPCDVYAFGVVLYFMATGRVPYGSIPAADLIEGVTSGSLQPEWPEGCAVMPQIRELCARCWRADPRVRPTFSEVCAALQAMENAVRQELRKPGSGSNASGVTESPYSSGQQMQAAAAAAAASAAAGSPARAPAAAMAAATTVAADAGAEGGGAVMAAVPRSGRPAARGVVRTLM